MADFLFANLIFNYSGNDPDGQSQAVATLNNNSPILLNPSQYYLFVSRFIVNGYNTPLIVPQVVSNQSNPNLTIYNVALSFNGTFSDPIPIIYVPASNNLPVPSAVGQYQDVSSQYYYIYTYNALCSMINTAFLDALTNLNTKIATGATEAPICYYDINNGITIKAPVANYGQDEFNPTPPNGFVQIYVNAACAPFFNGQNLSLLTNVTNCNWRIMLFPSVSNLSSDGDYFIQPPQNIQESNNVPSIQSYQVVTSMPIVQELSATPATSGITQAVPYNQISILTDLAPDNSNPVGYGTDQLYNQVSSLRLCELSSSDPLILISAKIQWQDQFGRTFPLLLGQGVQCSIKFGFIKKSVYKGIR